MKNRQEKKKRLITCYLVTRRKKKGEVKINSEEEPTLFKKKVRRTSNFKKHVYEDQERGRKEKNGINIKDNENVTIRLTEITMFSYCCCFSFFGIVSIEGGYWNVQ